MNDAKISKINKKYYNYLQFLTSFICEFEYPTSTNVKTEEGEKLKNIEKEMWSNYVVRTTECQKHL